MKKIVVLCTMLVLTGQVAAAPTVLFNTFGPGDTFVTNGYSLESPDEWCGSQFTIGSVTSYSLDKIELAAYLQAGTNDLDVWLMSDASGKPGTVMEAFNFSGQISPEPGSILSADSQHHPILDPGTPYWLVASTTTADTWVFWDLAPSNVYDFHMFAQRQGNQPWLVFMNYVPAFRVSGSPISPVPAPGALLLGGIGVGVVSWLRKRRTL